MLKNLHKNQKTYAFIFNFSSYIVTGSVGLCFCVSSQASSLVTDWNNVALQAIRDTRPGPPIGARDLFIVHNAIFDAWSAYDTKAREHPTYAVSICT